MRLGFINHKDQPSIAPKQKLALIEPQCDGLHAA
jgi:hypothetical protein